MQFIIILFILLVILVLFIVLNHNMTKYIPPSIYKIFQSKEKLQILYDYNNNNLRGLELCNNKKSVNSCKTNMNVYNINSNIKDKKILLPNQIHPMNIKSNIDLNQYLYQPPLDNYTVQSGIFDNNNLPQPQVYKPLSVAIQNYIDLEKDKKTNDKYIHEIYDGILNDRPISDKKVKCNNFNVIPAHKGYSLNMDNWNYYKNEEFANGGNYDNLIGIQNNKDNNMRIVDGYNDFELKEWI